MLAFVAFAAGEVEVRVELAALARELGALEHEPVRLEELAQVVVRERPRMARVARALEAIQLERCERIHRRNLIAQGIVPLLFSDESDYDKAELGQTWRIAGLHGITEGENELEAEIEGVGTITLTHDLLPREREIVVAGGLIRYLCEEQPARA